MEYTCEMKEGFNLYAVEGRWKEDTKVRTACILIQAKTIEAANGKFNAFLAKEHPGVSFADVTMLAKPEFTII